MGDARGGQDTPVVLGYCEPDQALTPCANRRDVQSGRDGPRSGLDHVSGYGSSRPGGIVQLSAHRDPRGFDIRDAGRRACFAELDPDGCGSAAKLGGF